jgi:hypothetical protein
MVNENRTFRTFWLRAMFCEQRAHDSSDQLVKRDWAELANEWHALAKAIAGASTDERQ